MALIRIKCRFIQYSENCRESSRFSCGCSVLEKRLNAVPHFHNASNNNNNIETQREKELSVEIMTNAEKQTKKSCRYTEIRSMC